MTKYLLLLCLALVPLAQADEASHRALATQFIDANDVPRSLRKAFLSLINPMVDGMKQRGMPEAAMTEMKAAITSWYDEEVKWDDLRPKFVEVYMKEFTEQELKEMVAFYESPTGKKTLATMPALMEQSNVIMQSYVQGKQASLNAKITPVVEKYRDQK